MYIAELSSVKQNDTKSINLPEYSLDNLNTIETRNGKIYSLPSVNRWINSNWNTTSRLYLSCSVILPGDLKCSNNICFLWQLWEPRWDYHDKSSTVEKCRLTARFKSFMWFKRTKPITSVTNFFDKPCVYLIVIYYDIWFIFQSSQFQCCEAIDSQKISS